MKFTLDRFVNAPADVTFETFSDFENSPEYIEAIERLEMLTDQPVGVGTKFRETRTMFGKEATEEFEVIEFDRPRRYVLRSYSCGAEYLCEFEFAEDGGGSRATSTVSTQAQTFFAKLFSPIGVLMSGTMKRLIAKDLADGAAAAEAKANPPEETDEVRT
ncbi:SRPBCC family protein [Stratiformator vulcanicus]|uniref:Polyketide cyclase / dehydrase and lipid transport n=1 Tax=Stratiformator vulcanicus TaxID=2527980 RepID=A0A517R5C2_9PLAN|nr:SRPBCC family protein [Stratiformator vulcanicus]QDT39023.1 Polyketide cyclase / dehydrase and lipid transport [Stratiformator vulcanicus]